MKIKIIDYIGYCNGKREPTGHTVKTLNDAGMLLKDDFEIEYIVPDIIKSFIKYGKVIKSFNIDNSKAGDNRNLHKIKYIIKKICVIKKILKMYDNEILWFLNTDFWLFFTLIFSDVKKNRIFVTNYIGMNGDSLKSRFKNSIYKNALKKTTKVFVSDIKVNDEKQIFIPDFYYDPRQYEKYVSKDKKNAVLSVGKMNPGKDIENLVDVFNKNGMDLTIAGEFNSKDIYNKVQSRADSNIKILNERIGYDDYYNMLGKYKFCVLPYKKNSYFNRSSGVILESLFLGAVIIAPDFLLEFTGINGIGYYDIHELEDLDLKKIENMLPDIYKQNRDYIKNYDANLVRERYLKAFKGI